MDQPTGDIEAFIARWQDVGGRERANYQLFLTELAALLELPAPEPAGDDERDNAYVFERRVDFHHGDGSESRGYIDLYRRGCFVLEAKDVRAASERRYDDTMLRARSQAEAYARALPAAEGRPPFVVVVDVGRVIELYSEFTRSGATYTPYPDPRSHRIALADLRNPAIRERLRQLWLDPVTLDPALEAARVTREIAARLAELARSLEHTHTPASVAQFLMRCLFTMFAEDVKLLPPDSFRELLEHHAEQPDVAMRMLGQLWQDMDRGGFSAAIASDVLHFNGKLFKAPETLPLTRDQIALLIEAARARWDHVEPAIFGTLLERALDPDERHKLGAHYTPRAYVERLVLPAVIEPLRKEWSDAQAAALTLATEGKAKRAVAVLRAFHHRLCNVRVLDPACGSGNFLYVTLEHLKRLEGEVFNALDELGFQQTELAIDGQRADATAGETVDPHQLLGIEINPRAAAITEVVLWIGYLQWHFRTHGNVNPPQPVVRDFHNIENRDAVLACDGVEYVTDERGVPVARWDGTSYKPSPVTGEPIPDDTARLPLERYVNPRKAAWPQADFVVGNPPFIGNKRMRIALGDGYVEALRGAWPGVPESADFVMYWWHHAAVATARGALQRFGFITTNSISQAFNRRIVEGALSDKKHPLSLAFAVPDHPWVDTADGAAVRIAMSVADSGTHTGRLLKVVQEHAVDDGEVAVNLRERRGKVHADLTVGANTAGTSTLLGNAGLALRGITLVGTGFVLTAEQAKSLENNAASVSQSFVKPFFNGRDITQSSRNVFVIDLFGLSAEEVRRNAPDIYQWVTDRVKPERDQNARKAYRMKWWIFAEPRSEFRAATKTLARYIATPMTAKHRMFVWLPAGSIPDQGLVPIALDDAIFLGILSSEVHVTWALATGGTLEDRPRYNQSRCFDAFPFPVASEKQQVRIRELAEQLDTHRKRQQAQHPDLTLTGMYNVLEKLRSGAALTPKERTIHEQGLVSVLRQLHDDLDAAVLDAYGWSDLLPLLRVGHGNDALLPSPVGRGAGGEGSSASKNPAGPEPSSGAARHLLPGGEGKASARGDAKRVFDDAVLERLVALNAERAAEEARGLVRWLRPEFQHPTQETVPQQAEIEGTDAAGITPVAAKLGKRQPWPTETIDQVRAVMDVLSASAAPLSVDDIAARFTRRGPWKKRLPPMLDMLTALGRAHERAGRYSPS